MALVDRATILQIIGSLMKKPQYLSETDKYNLTPDDFYYKIDKYIFAAIDSLYRNGAQRIQPIDVENYLSTNESAKLIFKQQNGIEYLQDADELSDELNFNYYYKRLKKYNLLDSFTAQGIDINDFYVENPLTDQALKINEKFEELDIDDIVTQIKSKILTVEREFIQNDTTETISAFEGIKEIISGAEEQADVGLPLQGEIFNEVCAGARKGIFVLRSAGSGTGKALPNSTIIPTPSGKKRVDEVKVGDYLFDAFGNPTKVLGVYPQGRKEVHYVRFKDGRISLCCDEHLWSYCTLGQKEKSKKDRKFLTKTLAELKKEKLQNKDGSYRILVPMNYAVEYDKKNYYIPPYIFGLALGDGSFKQHNSNKSFQFSSENSELPNIIGETMGWTVKKNSAVNYTWHFSLKEKQEKAKDKINIWVEDFLHDYPDLINRGSKEKYIPEDYLYGSIEQRYDLLSGLLDSDGSVDEKGRITYFTISEKLRDNVVELCHSLGFKTTVMVDNHKNTNIGFIIHITGRPQDKIKLFHLKRKKGIITKWYNSDTRKECNEFNPIIEIGSCGYTEEMTCFYVDNDEHLFLTNDYIVTHNTRNAVGDACYLAFPFRYDEKQDRWIQIGGGGRVLYITTEQTPQEIQKMILAYLTGFNETKFRYGGFTEKEMRVIEQALYVLEAYRDNFFIVRMPNPTIELIKTIVRENVLLHDLEYVFYDYIHISPSLLAEFKGFHLRDDKLLSYI